MLIHYFLVVTTLAVSLGLLSRRLDGIPVSEPMLGLGAGLALGPQALGFLRAPDDTALFLELTRVLLAFTVMTVALRYPWADLRLRVRSVSALIVLVLPLSALAMAVVGRPSCTSISQHGPGSGGSAL